MHTRFFAALASVAGSPGQFFEGLMDIPMDIPKCKLEWCEEIFLNPYFTALYRGLKRPHSTLIYKCYFQRKI